MYNCVHFQVLQSKTQASHEEKSLSSYKKKNVSDCSCLLKHLMQPQIENCFSGQSEKTSCLQKYNSNNTSFWYKGMNGCRKFLKLVFTEFVCSVESFLQ
jgi:hypothetical protein